MASRGPQAKSASPSRTTGGDRPDPRGRDFVDHISDAWRATLPSAEHPELALGRRAIRLSTILQDRLSVHLANWDLTRGDYDVLNVLRSSGAPYELRPTDLKASLLLSSGGVTNILNRLEAAGLVEREKDGRDGRSSWVRLTKAGAKTAEDVFYSWSDTLADVFRAVPPEAVQIATDAMREVLIALGDLGPSPAASRATGGDGRGNDAAPDRRPKTGRDSGR
ncbi:MarR family winged helix-turn-helix transcriptional regulator [Streptomyces sp. NPDC056716]|uniref:MarR family winged helix-turn-helix transcriptional regulator n=1 Tax=unclassified Streptomyces TaxID=2593676 RepID=UPI00368D0785